MPYIEVDQENTMPIDLYYEDIGQGRPVVLIHGWPLKGHSWEKQIPQLLQNGYRVITYDRRGFGDSSRPSAGYNYDTFAEDLNKLMTELDLTDATIVGFSMGTGEVARYLGKYGSERVSQAVMIGVIPPFLLKTDDNPTGVDKSTFDGIKQAIQKDRLAFLSEFLNNFYNADKLMGTRLSEEAVRWSWNVGAAASAIAFYQCVDAWVEDFRQDVAKIDVPTLIIHGDSDRILPFDSTAKQLEKAIDDSRLVVLKDGPHGVLWTHAEEINRELITFLAESKATQKRMPASREQAAGATLQ